MSEAVSRLAATIVTDWDVQVVRSVYGETMAHADQVVGIVNGSAPEFVTE